MWYYWSNITVVIAAEMKAKQTIVKRVPKGTSAYQAAWIIESEDEDEVCLGWFLNVHYAYNVSQNVPLSSFLFFLE